MDILEDLPANIICEQRPTRGYPGILEVVQPVISPSNDTSTELTDLQQCDLLAHGVRQLMTERRREEIRVHDDMDE